MLDPESEIYGEQLRHESSMEQQEAHNAAKTRELLALLQENKELKRERARLRALTQN